MKKRPVVLVILDGWGINHHDDQVNGIKMAKPLNFERYKKEYPFAELRADGGHVGLPDGQFGNSEVGHTNIGAGRTVFQMLPKISKAINDGSILENEVLANVMDTTKNNGKALHILGLASDGGVHCHIDHIIGLVDMAAKKGITEVYVHPITDGRDTAPESGVNYLAQLQEGLDKIGVGKIATIIGRYYGMDRDNNWDREKLAYDALTSGDGEVYPTADEAIKASYAKGVTDEFVVPVKIGSKDNGLIKDGDGVIFANFRPDRARQLTRMFVDPEFKGFDRKVYPKVNFVTMAQYDASFDSPIAFPPEKIVNCFGEVVSKAGLIQVRTAETEKYAHVTFFFNGGKEEPYPGEIRLLSDSPKVATYDLQPEMSAYKVKDRLIEELNTGKVDTVILNFANPDMVGHTGNVQAVIEACQAVDNCLGQIVRKVLEMDGALFITADHGNADLLVNPETGEPHTAHTVNPVPFIFISNDMKDAKLRKGGKLADIAPTMLELLGLEKPAEMDGSSLIEK